MPKIKEAISSLEEGGPSLRISLEDFACTSNKYRKERTTLYQKAQTCDKGLKTHYWCGNELVVDMLEVFHPHQGLEQPLGLEEHSWNLLIPAYVSGGQFQEALALYEDKQGDDSFHPQGSIFVALLNACTALHNIEKGCELHAAFARSGFFETDAFVGSALVHMYAKCGFLLRAQEVFEKLCVRDVVTWTALLCAYVNHGQAVEALNCFERMQYEGFSPNSFTFVCTLKACGFTKAISKGREVHTEVVFKGVENEVLVGNTLVDMYVRCGFVTTALEVLQKLSVRNVVSWNVLFAGFAEQGCGEEALCCYETMRQEGFIGDMVTLLCCLKASGSIGATISGQEIHTEIIKRGEAGHTSIGNTLIDMYAKCGCLLSAQDVFRKLPARDIISWNVLMAGFLDHGQGAEVFGMFEQMQLEGVCLDVITCSYILKACSILKDAKKGRGIHIHVVKKGYEKEYGIGNSLIDMYAKCGLLATAQQVFEKLPAQDVISWTALMVGYREHGSSEDTLHLVREMQHEGIPLNSLSLVCTLKACSIHRDLKKGQELHTEVVKKGLERETIVENTLVDMYAKSGALEDAHNLFDSNSLSEMVAWTALIAGYVEHGLNEEALGCLKQMQDEGVYCDAVTLTLGLKASANMGATDKGRMLHGEIEKKGLLERDIVTGTLVDMYAKCDSLQEAHHVFDRLHGRDVVSWTALLTGYADHKCHEEALNCFQQMQRDVCPDAATFVCCLRSCGGVGDIAKGRELHSETVIRGLEKEILIGGALVDMYVKCGSLIEAQQLFDLSPIKDAIWWNTLVSGYAEEGHGEKSLHYYDEMEGKGISHECSSIVACLKACGAIGATFKGQEVHAETVQKGFEMDNLVGNILVDMYARCGLLAEAQNVFDHLLAQGVIAWTALIAGYMEHGHGEEALDCFTQMQRRVISMDAMILACGITACSSIGSLVKGRQIHSEIIKRGLENESRIGNILVDMYGKCKSLVESQKVFDKLLKRDVISWNSLIGAFAQSGSSNSVFLTFDRMLEEGIKPDLVTFAGILSSCNHSGLLQKGETHFDALSKEYGLVPTLEHYTCMVDLLGRAGHVERAAAMIKKMPCHPDIFVWHIVLGACRKWGNVELGRHAFEQAVRLDDSDMAAYVCMFNIYADAAMQEEADQIEAMRLEKRAWKMPSDGRIKKFLGVGDLGSGGLMGNFSEPTFPRLGSDKLVGNEAFGVVHRAWYSC